MKTLKWWRSRGYLYQPTVSFVLHTHNMSGAAIRVIDDLRQFTDAEIIVLDDGSSHDHTRLLIDHLNGVNEFVLHANDLFDVIVFNRAFAFARGKYIAVIQDDDEYKGKTWVTKATEILDRDPKLAVLGGRDRVLVSKGSDPWAGREGAFQYAQIVNAAPMWVRRDAFLDLGGFDIDFAPMLWHEADLCLKAWLSGYHVGWYKSAIDVRAILARDRRDIRSDLVEVSTLKNYTLLMKKYGSKLDGIQKLAERMNRR